MVRSCKPVDRLTWLSVVLTSSHQFKHRKSLKYLHIFDRHKVLDLKQQILEDPPASLKLLGYGPFLRWLVRDHDDPNDDRPKYSPCWSASKLHFRTAQDFGCTDWEWLLRWHDYYDLGRPLLSRRLCPALLTMGQMTWNLVPSTQSRVSCCCNDPRSSVRFLKS